MTPTLAISFAHDDAAEAERLDALTEVFVLAALRPRVRRFEELVAQGTHARPRFRFGLRKIWRRLAVRSYRAVGWSSSPLVVLRAGAETVRLPFA